MKNDFFYIAFNKFRYSKDGEATPFLLIVLVILLIAAFSLVNIGKIGIRRTQTANATDAAAIAAATTLATVANQIAEANIILRNRFLAFQFVVLPSTGFNCWHPLCNANVGCPTQLWDHSIYMNYMVGIPNGLLWSYLTLIYNSEKGFKTARQEAHRTAFSNAGIQEAQIRRRSDKEIQPSHLSQWLNNNEFPGSLYTYQWHSYVMTKTTIIDPETGKEKEVYREAPEPEPNEVTSEVNINDCAFALDPWPLMPVWKEYKFFVTGIRDLPTPKDCKFCKCGSDWDCLANDQAAFSNWLADIAGRQNEQAKIAFALTIAGFTFMSCTQPDVEAIIAALLTSLDVIPVVFPIVQTLPKKQCIGTCTCDATHIPAPKPATVLVMYLVPVPWINSIRNDDNIRVRTRVTYAEPSRVTGIWQRKRSATTSRATARLLPGDIGIFSQEEYDAELVGAE